MYDRTDGRANDPGCLAASNGHFAVPVSCANSVHTQLPRRSITEDLGPNQRGVGAIEAAARACMATSAAAAQAEAQAHAEVAAAARAQAEAQAQAEADAMEKEQEQEQ